MVDYEKSYLHDYNLKRFHFQAKRKKGKMMFLKNLKSQIFKHHQNKLKTRSLNIQLNMFLQNKE